MPQRLTHLIDESDAYIVLGGGLGTVVELLTTLENERIARKISEGKKPHRPVILLDQSLSHADLLAELSKDEKKLKEPEVLDNVYILGVAPEAVEITQSIVEGYYQKSLGKTSEIEEGQESFSRYNLGEFLKRREQFKEGEGI